jgi:hypothetical protein
MCRLPYSTIPLHIVAPSSREAGDGTSDGTASGTGDRTGGGTDGVTGDGTL